MLLRHGSGARACAQPCRSEARAYSAYGSTELRVGDAVYFITSVKAGHSRSNCLDDAREIGAKGEWRLRADFALAFTNQRIPWTNSGSGHVYEDLAIARNWPRNVVDDNDVG